MSGSIDLWYADEQFIDIAVYYPTPDGGDYRVIVYKDLLTGSVGECEPCFSASEDDVYDSYLYDLPQEVRNFIDWNMAEILVRIGSAQADVQLRAAPKYVR